MSAILIFLRGDHIHGSLIAACVVAAIGGFLTMSLIERVRDRPLGQNWIWLLLAGIVGGMTVWCTHFAAMLGYDIQVPHAYDPVLTFFSLGIAVFAMTAGTFIAANAGQSALAEAGGAVAGLGIAVMHFVGMAGFHAPGHFEWSAGYVFLASVLGIIFSMLAFSAPLRMRPTCCQLLPTAFFIAAIFCVHFISMKGLHRVDDGTLLVPGTGLTPQTMMFFVAQGISVVVILGLALLIIEAKNREQVSTQVHIAGAHDGLTGLPNRSAFSDLLARMVVEEEARNGRFELGLLDIIGFKEINDVHGHGAGDYILGHVARSLEEQLPVDSFVARVGDDEFAVIIPESGSRNDAVAQLPRALNVISRPISWENTRFEVRLHCGLASFPSDGTTTEELMARADVALQRARRGGTAGIVFYDVRRDQGERRLNALALDMRRALEDGEFQLYYQQQHLAEDHAIFGFEVLLRWFHRDLGLISPAEFIPVAERTGFILTLGEWVLREACRDAVTWRNPFQIGVNVAANQLADPHFPAKVAAILKETGFPAGRLELEFTESGLIEDARHAFDSIIALKKLGLKVAMDDFGTGYSSLATLQRFPFDKIKIDRSFVEGLPDDGLSAAIVRATVIIGKSLGIRVLAEGVEKKAQLDYLIKEGCLRAQGYYFGRPKPREEIEPLVSGENIRVAKLPPVRAIMA